MNTTDTNETPKRRLEDHQPAARINWATPDAPAVTLAPAPSGARTAISPRFVASLLVDAGGVSVFPTGAAKHLPLGHYVLSTGSVPAQGVQTLARGLSDDEILQLAAANDIHVRLGAVRFARSVLAAASQSTADIRKDGISPAARLQGAATITNEQITAGATVLGDDGKPIGRNTAIMVWEAMGGVQVAPAAIPEAVRRALETIAAWELPETGKFWPSGKPTSYETERGSNGARSYMRQVASNALAALAAARAPVAPEQDQAKAEPLWIQLGKGAIEIGQGHHGYEDARLPAILFGRNGAGAVGVETEGDRHMEQGECIAAITFENPESLDVVAEKLAELRDRIWPEAPAAHIAPAEAQDDVAAEMDRLHDALCFWLPQNHAGLPEAMQERIAADAYLLVGYDDSMADKQSAEELGWVETAAHIASKPNADSAWKTYIAQRKGLMDTSSNRAIFVAGYSAAATPAASAPTDEQDLLDIVRSFCNVAKRLTELTPQQREHYPSPLSPMSPLFQAASAACIERGYDEWGIGIEGVKYPVAPAASADAVIEAREQALTIKGSVCEIGDLMNEDGSQGVVIERENNFVTIKGLYPDEVRALAPLLFGDATLSFATQAPKGE